MVRGMSTSHAAGPLHGHDDFDPEPTNELSAGEPRTPLWLPALGAALFLLAAVYSLVPSQDEAPAVDARADVVAVAEPAPAAVPPMAPAPRDAPTRAEAADAVKKLSPEQIAELRKRVEKMRQQGAVPTP
jgi:hypothetical protein